MTQPNWIVKVKRESYAAGLADGEKRLARTLERWLKTQHVPNSGYQLWDKIQDWLFIRAKRRKPCKS
jgi:hypothetical protein